MRTSQQANGGYSIRDADLVTDAASITELWARNLNGYDLKAASAKLIRGYRDNPAGGASVQLLAVQGEPVAVGAQGLHSRTFWLGDRSLSGIGLGDFVVNEAHRSLWPALLLIRHCIQLGTERFDLT